MQWGCKRNVIYIGFVTLKGHSGLRAKKEYALPKICSEAPEI